MARTAGAAREAAGAMDARLEPTPARPGTAPALARVPPMLPRAPSRAPMLARVGSASRPRAATEARRLSNSERSASTRAGMASGGVRAASWARRRRTSSSSKSRRTGIRIRPSNSRMDWRMSATRRRVSTTARILTCARFSIRSRYLWSEVAKLLVFGRTRTLRRPVSRPPGPAMDHPRWSRVLRQVEGERVGGQVQGGPPAGGARCLHRLGVTLQLAAVDADVVGVREAHRVQQVRQ